MLSEKRRTRKNKKSHPPIEHHHLLMRIETSTCPLEKDKDKMGELIREIVNDVSMVPLGPHQVFYMKEPKYNEGLTAIQTIQTSHIAFHFWKNPDKNILQSKRSNCLLQMDVYTCGKLTVKQISIILNALARFDPTHADITLLNRRWSLRIEKQDNWKCEDNKSWAQWILDRF